MLQEEVALVCCYRDSVCFSSADINAFNGAREEREKKIPAGPDAAARHNE